ncbi:MAG: divergent polysaccharide deacetylase family protein [Candidatus Eremiobacteraeota bacterium]|nr:divergent polysaccharide deacetylase family protein [Candidatus Eremiobacteraeota bacterium]
MPRKRKRRGRPGRRRILPFIILAVLIALVVGALLPRAGHRIASHRRYRPVAQVTAAPAPVVTATPTPQPQPSSPSAPAEPVATPTYAGSGPVVAIIIDDCGQWLDTERGYVALPIPLTLSVLPHVRYAGLIANEARAGGKAVMLHLPMEPISHMNPGPGEIKTSMSDAEIIAQTQDDLAQVPLATGVNNHEGSEASADPRVMQAVMDVVKDHGIFFVDSMTNAKSIAAQTARNDGVPTASRDVFLDNQEDVAYSESMLERAVAVAKANGSAIAIGHPRPTTLAALRDSYAKMEAEGIHFVFVSQLVH